MNISDSSLIPRVVYCPFDTRKVTWTQTYKKVNGSVRSVYLCSCEDFCRWDICRLDKPPHSCLDGTKSHWLWDSQKRYWVAQISSGNYLLTK